MVPQSLVLDAYGVSLGPEPLKAFGTCLLIGLRIVVGTVLLVLLVCLATPLYAVLLLMKFVLLFTTKGVKTLSIPPWKGGV